MAKPSAPPPPDLPAMLDTLHAAAPGAADLAAHLRAGRHAEAWARFGAIVKEKADRARLLEALHVYDPAVWLAAMLSAFHAGGDPVDLARVAELTGYERQTLRDLRVKHAALKAVEVTKRGPERAFDHDEAIRLRTVEKWTLTRIARHFDVRVSVVSMMLTRKGIPSKRSGRKATART